MGNQDHTSFTLNDLGLLKGPPLKGFETVVLLASKVLRTKIALMMVDDENGSVFLRASFGLDKARVPPFGFPLYHSIVSDICSEDISIQINDVSRSNHLNTVEADFFGAKSFLGTPVHDPAGAPVGVLCAMTQETHNWTDAQIEALEALAYLVSQQIMLKASFATLRLMKQQSGIPLV